MVHALETNELQENHACGCHFTRCGEYSTALIKLLNPLLIDVSFKSELGLPTWLNQKPVRCPLEKLSPPHSQLQVIDSLQERQSIGPGEPNLESKGRLGEVKWLPLDFDVLLVLVVQLVNLKLNVGVGFPAKRDRPHQLVNIV